MLKIVYTYNVVLIKEDIRMRKDKFYLDRNESQFPLAPACRGIINKKYQQYMLRYAEKSMRSFQNQLLEKLQHLTGVSTANIALSNGCEEILKVCLQYYMKKGDTVLIADKSWGHYRTLINAVDGTIAYFDIVEGRDKYKYDIAAFKKSYQKNAPKIVIVASPNNPTGNSIQFKMLCEFIKIAKKSIFILDEAYWGFEKENKSRIKKLLKLHDKLLITRSFSKYFGMPGVRLGYCIGGSYFNKFKENFNPYLGFNQISALFGLCALHDLAYYKKLAKIIESEKQKYYNHLKNSKIFKIFKTETNFIIIKYIASMDQYIKDRIQSSPFFINFPKEEQSKYLIRITITTPSINKKMLSFLLGIDRRS